MYFPSGSSYPDIVLTNMCKKNCPNGWASSSIDCFKPSSYGRGFGLDFGTRVGHGILAQEKIHKGVSIAYPKCRNGFHPVGCCVCSPDCPAGSRNILSYTTSTM